MTITAEEADQALSKVRQNLWILEQRVQQLQTQLCASPTGGAANAPPTGSQGSGQRAFVPASDAQKELIMKLCSQLDCQLPNMQRMSKSEASEWIERHLELRKELLGY